MVGCPQAQGAKSNDAITKTEIIILPSKCVPVSCFYAMESGTYVTRISSCNMQASKTAIRKLPVRLQLKNA